MTTDRFQNQNFFIKLWRLRFYLLIPYYTLGFLKASKGQETIKNCWNLAKSCAQIKMKWLYDFPL